jgi:hypothetical protein
MITAFDMMWIIALAAAITAVLSYFTSTKRDERRRQVTFVFDTQQHRDDWARRYVASALSDDDDGSVDQLDLLLKYKPSEIVIEVDYARPTVAQIMGDYHDVNEVEGEEGS